MMAAKKQASKVSKKTSVKKSSSIRVTKKSAKKRATSKKGTSKASSAKKTVKKATSSIKARAVLTTAQAKNAAKNLEAQAVRHITAAKVELQRAEQKLKAYVKKNPEKATLLAAGVAAAVGATIGALAARKKKKE